MGSDSESGYDSDVDFRGRHKFTDLPCCVMFVATMAGFFGLLHFAHTAGDLKKLYHGVDKTGAICGVADSVIDKPYLYWCHEETEGTVSNKHAVCLEGCPAEGLPVGECLQYGLDVTAEHTEHNPLGHCEPPKVDHDMDKDYWEALGADEMGLRHGKTVLLVAIVCTILTGYVYLWVLRKTATCLVYVFTIFSVLGMLLLGYAMWSMPPFGTANGHGRSGGFPARKRIAVGCWLTAVLIVLVFWCYRKAIKTSLACIECAVLIMFKMPCLLFAPMQQALVKAVFWMGAVYGFVHIVALADFVGIPNSGGMGRVLDPNSEVNGHVYMALAFFVFAMIWALEFVNAVYMFTISYATGYYYFAEPDDNDDRDVPCDILRQGTWVALFKHTGSLAYGSVMITVVSVFFWGLAYLDQQAQAGCNPCVVAVSKCLMFCCKCVQGCVGFINKNCYTEMAITGNHGFCDSIQGVMKVMIDQGSTMVILNAATFMIMVQGVFQMVSVGAIVSAVMLQQEKYSDPTSPSHIESGALIMIMVCILGATIGWTFMSVFDTVTDALLFCFAIDKLDNDGQVTTAPKDFLDLYNTAEEILIKKNKKEERKKKKKTKADAEPLVGNAGRPECKMGCGRLVAHGRTRNGQFYDTCCRGCATGGDHDPSCQA